MLSIFILVRTVCVRTGPSEAGGSKVSVTLEAAKG